MCVCMCYIIFSYMFIYETLSFSPSPAFPQIWTDSSHVTLAAATGTWFVMTSSF